MLRLLLAYSRLRWQMQMWEFTRSILAWIYDDYAELFPDRGREKHFVQFFWGHVFCGTFLANLIRWISDYSVALVQYANWIDVWIEWKNIYTLWCSDVSYIIVFEAWICSCIWIYVRFIQIICFDYMSSFIVCCIGDTVLWKTIITHYFVFIYSAIVVNPVKPFFWILFYFCFL